MTRTFKTMCAAHDYRSDNEPCPVCEIQTRVEATTKLNRAAALVELRDTFAAAALPSFIVLGAARDWSKIEVVEAAYRLADAVLAARNKP